MKTLLRITGLFFVLLIAVPHQALSQTVPGLETLSSSGAEDAALTDEQVRAIEDLIVTLESETGRSDLIAELKALIDAHETVKARADTGDGGDSESEGEDSNRSVSELLPIDDAANNAIAWYETWLSQVGIQDSAAKKYAMAAVIGAVWLLGLYLISLLARKIRQRLNEAVSPDFYRRRRIAIYISVLKFFFLFGATVASVYLFVLTLNWNIEQYPLIPSAPYLFGVGGGIALLFIVAAVLYEMLYSGLDRISESGNGRLRTIAPLIRNIVLLVMFVLGGLTVLSELGVNVMPFLAGAGVVGIAIGFGAQAVFKDLITGLIVIIEDLFQIGDWVAVGGSEGTVERITFRKVDLRDLSGTVHTIPFGSIDTVKNYMKDFSYAVLNVEIAYREDTDAVTEELIDIDRAVREDDTYGRLITEEMQIMGIDSLGDSSVAIKVRIKTQPGEQWGVAREYRRRIKYRFDEAGIEIPFPHQTLYFGQPKTGTAPPAMVSIAGQDDPPAADEDGSEKTGETAEAKDRESRKRSGSQASEDGAQDSD